MSSDFLDEDGGEKAAWIPSKAFSLLVAIVLSKECPLLKEIAKPKGGFESEVSLPNPETSTTHGPLHQASHYSD